MTLFDVNLLAVLLATLSSFVTGGLWYSVLFGKPWGRVSGSDARTPPSPGITYGSIFLINIVSAFVFGFLFPNFPSLGTAVFTGFGVGAGIVVLSYAVNYIGAGRHPLLLLIDGGFQIVRFTAFGLIFGLIG